METRACPDCGASNRLRARSCRLCGRILREQLAQRPRVQRKLLRRTDFHAAARANRRATRNLVLMLLLITGGLGYLVGWNLELLHDQGMPRAVSTGGLWGTALLLAIGGAWSAIALSRGDRIVLRLMDARLVTPEQEPVLHNVVEEMAIAAGVPKPAVYLLETDALNAFATGLDTRRAAIGVTRGLLRELDREELQGVVAHEMGHVVNLDMRYATAVGVLVGLVALVADFGWRLVYGGGRRRGGKEALPVAILLLLVAVLAPLAAKLVQMAVSRQREFLADATSVRLTRDPQGLIRALEKLERNAVPFHGANRATQHLFIVNPFRDFSEQAGRLLATHPPIAARIYRLTHLGG